MTDFELICVGFFIGIFFSMIMIGVGVAYDTRFIKRKLDDDSDVRVYVYSRDRSRSGNNGCPEQVGAETKEQED